MESLSDRIRKITEDLHEFTLFMEEGNKKLDKIILYVEKLEKENEALKLKVKELERS